MSGKPVSFPTLLRRALTWFIHGGSARAALYTFCEPGVYAYVTHNLIEAVELGDARASGRAIRVPPDNLGLRLVVEREKSLGLQRLLGRAASKFKAFPQSRFARAPIKETPAFRHGHSAASSSNIMHICFQACTLASKNVSRICICAKLRN